MAVNTPYAGRVRCDLPELAGIALPRIVAQSSAATSCLIQSRNARTCGTLLRCLGQTTW